MKEHGRMFDKLDVLVKDLKEHDSTLFQPNGLALKQGERLLYPPSLTIPEECINVEDVAELLMRRDAP